MLLPQSLPAVQVCNTVVPPLYYVWRCALRLQPCVSIHEEDCVQRLNGTPADSAEIGGLAAARAAGRKGRVKKVGEARPLTVRKQTAWQLPGQPLHNRSASQLSCPRCSVYIPKRMCIPFNKATMCMHTWRAAAARRGCCLRTRGGPGGS
eukprot:206912-Chlamydomonas_euryale.AAC.2